MCKLTCNCEGGTVFCPVQGACKQEGVVYEACVRERNSGKTETYTGLTGRSFKQRWKEHQRDFDNPDKKERDKTKFTYLGIERPRGSS